MLFNEAGELLLIRNSYGDCGLFVLPGGGVGRRENPEAAAVREVREELGVQAREISLIATYQSGAEGKRDSIHLFRAAADGVLKPDPVEIEEAAYSPLARSPGNVSPATLRRIREYEGERPIDDRW